MGNIRQPSNLSNTKTQEEFQRSLSRYIDELHPTINGGLEFDKNIKSQTIVQYFKTAAANVAISHNLNKTGVHYWIARKTAACDIYNGTGIDTTSVVNLASSVSGVTVTLILY
jgi:hypothetical protein